MHAPFTNRYTSHYFFLFSCLFVVKSSQSLEMTVKFPFLLRSHKQRLDFVLYMRLDMFDKRVLFRYTSKDNHVFAIALKWPRSGRLALGDVTPTSKTRVKMLGTEKNLKWTHGSEHKSGKNGIVIHVPAIPVSELPCLWAWVFKLSHIK